jgi:hypothetical protein
VVKCKAHSCRYVLLERLLSRTKLDARERDTRFVEPGRYLCEVRTGQYWCLEHLTSFDDFPQRRFPESRRKATYWSRIFSQNSGEVPSAAESLKDIEAEIPACPFTIRDRCARVTPNREAASAIVIAPR